MENAPTRKRPRPNASSDPGIAPRGGSTPEGTGPGSSPPIHPRPAAPAAEGADGSARLRACTRAHFSQVQRRAKPPEERGPARAGPSASGATLKAPDEKGGVESRPPPPPIRPTADEWLPSQAFLPPETQVPAPASWSPWTSTQGIPHRPRGSGRNGPSPAGWSSQRALDEEEAAQSADQVYASADALEEAWHARSATRTDMPEFRAWERSNPTFKPRLSGFSARHRRDAHCFICSRLVATPGARPSGQPGPTRSATCFSRRR